MKGVGRCDSSFPPLCNPCPRATVSYPLRSFIAISLQIDVCNFYRRDDSETFGSTGCPHESIIATDQVRWRFQKPSRRPLLRSALLNLIVRPGRTGTSHR